MRACALCTGKTSITTSGVQKGHIMSLLSPSLWGPCCSSPQAVSSSYKGATVIPGLDILAVPPSGQPEMPLFLSGPYLWFIQVKTASSFWSSLLSVPPLHPEARGTGQLSEPLQELSTLPALCARAVLSFSNECALGCRAAMVSEQSVLHMFLQVYSQVLPLPYP